MTKRTSFLSIANLLTLLVIVPMAFASEGGGHEEQITFVGDWLPRLVNFLIIAGVIVYFMRKPAVDFFKNRSLEIEKAMKGSKEARDQAVAALAEMERKIRDLESETKALIADAQARGEKDKAALVEEGKRMSKEIQEQVKSAMEIEVAKAKADLAVEAAGLAVDLAEGKIKSSIGKQDHERIVKDYIANVGGRR
ncbi:MAG: ATP synthase F0 subunit B [Nitrospiraceae bacterium]|nr:ATP synthase F0 subunit B [Nitrospiraceae bacterium]